MAMDLRLFCCHITFVTRFLSMFCAADLTGQYVRCLLEPAFSSVPKAAEIPALFKSVLSISGTLPFPVPDAFYESQRRQDGDMKHLAPVSQDSALKCMIYLSTAFLREQRWYKQVCFWLTCLVSACLCFAGKFCTSL